MNDNNYRIVEYNGEFTIEVQCARIERKYNLFSGWKEILKGFEWLKIDYWGNPAKYNPSVKPFKNLNEANEFIKVVRKGEVYHYPDSFAQELEIRVDGKKIGK